MPSLQTIKMMCVGLALAVGAQVLPAQEAGPSPAPGSISIAPKLGSLDTYFYKELVLPSGKVEHAWTAISAGHEYVLYINGKEASRSGYGRVASAFRAAEEIVDLGPYLKAGKNALAVKSHVWSMGTADAPSVPSVRIQGQVKIGDQTVALQTDESWVGSYAVGANWTAAGFAPHGWPAVKSNADPGARMYPRIPKDQKSKIMPDVPAPLTKSVLAMLPQIAEMSDWSQQVVYRDVAKETERLLTIFPSQDIAQRLALAISSPNINMGDSMSINAYSIGNGWVWTSQGGYPFYNTNVMAAPEYQYPSQWNSGSTFFGDGVTVTADGKPLDTRNQWMWKIRHTDVVVTAACGSDAKVVFYTVTIAPPDLKGIVRIFAVANDSGEALKDVRVTLSVSGHSFKEGSPDGMHAEGNTLRESVIHGEMKAGAQNKRSMIAGALEDGAVTAAAPAVVADAANKIVSATGTLEIKLGDIAPGACAKQMSYRVFSLTMWDNKDVAPDFDKTLATVKAKNYKLLDETVKYWRDYNAGTTNLEAPGPWGKRVADFIDDEKMMVQTQQFARTGAVGPMSFFSDEWIRDACGPIKSFLRTGRGDNARRAIDYFYIASVANRIVLNWVGMDVDIAKAWPPIEDWTKISVNAGGGDHVSAEVPSWLILQHWWYVKYTGNLDPVKQHWDYLKRLYYGQFDNATDKIFRPDFKIPFHGDETYIYSGGEALWENRYDLLQNSYPGGNIYSADSSFEFVAAGDALVELGKLVGKDDDAKAIADINAKARSLTEKYYWMEDLGFYAQGMSVLYEGQLNRFPMANMNANVIWSGYGKPTDKKAISTVERMMEYLMEDSGVFNPIVGYDVTVGMLQGQCLHSLAAINHPWSEKAFYALMMIAGDTTEFVEWMAPGRDYRTMYRANRLRPWEGGINLDAAIYFLSGMEPDAPNKSLALTPRLPGGIYSPIKWDTYTLKKIPIAQNFLDLSVSDTGKGQRTYTIASAGKDDLGVTFNVLIPFAKLTKIQVDGKDVTFTASDVYSQALATIRIKLPAGKTATVVASYQALEPKAVTVNFKEFRPTEPKFDRSDIVIFNAVPKPKEGEKALHTELAKTHKVITMDASIPTDPATFGAALLTKDGLNTKMLILGAGSMYNRKLTFWWDGRFDEVVGTFLKRGGVLLEANSGLPSSRWLEKTLGNSTFSVDYAATGFAVAMDKSDPVMDEKFRWVDEMNIGTAGKWSSYWEGWYNMPYSDGGATIKDHFFIWGEQEQKDAAMQFTMKAVPGKDHMIRIRTVPAAAHGFTLQATDDKGATWKTLETVWAPKPNEVKQNGWVDVYLTLPAKYITEKTVTFRIQAPKGSQAAIGAVNSTGAARIWIRDSMVKPPSTTDIATTSADAAKLGLPDKGMVAYSQGRITFGGFSAPYRILGDSGAAAIIFKPIGKGVYVKSEVVVEESFSLDKMIKFVETLLKGR